MQRGLNKHAGFSEVEGDEIKASLSPQIFSTLTVALRIVFRPNRVVLEYSHLFSGKLRWLLKKEMRSCQVDPRAARLLVCFCTTEIFYLCRQNIPKLFRMKPSVH